MTGVYNKAKSEEVAPEISSAIIRACALFGVTFAKDLDRDASLADERDAGMEQGACARERFRRFCSLMAYFAPSVVPPFRENLTSNLGRRVRESSLSDAHGGGHSVAGGGVSGGPSKGPVLRRRDSGACSR